MDVQGKMTLIHIYEVKQRQTRPNVVRVWRCPTVLPFDFGAIGLGVQLWITVYQLIVQMFFYKFNLHLIRNNIQHTVKIRGTTTT